MKNALPYPHHTDPKWDTPQLIYGTEQPVMLASYSDRLRYQDRDAAARARAATGADQPQTVAGWTKWLSAYHERPVIVRYIKAAANLSSGHPYYELGYDFSE